MCISRLHLPLKECYKLPVQYAIEALRDHVEFTGALEEAKEKSNWYRLQTEVFIVVNTILAVGIGKKAMYKSPDDLLPLPWKIGEAKPVKERPTLEQMQKIYESLRALDDGDKKGKHSVRPDNEGV